MSQASMNQPLLLVATTTVRHENYKSRCSLFLNIAQIILGAICILCQTAAIILSDTMALYAGGIWGGILMVVAGGTGIGAAKLKTACLITTTMVMSVLASSSVLYIIMYSSIGILMKNEYPYRTSTCIRSDCPYGSGCTYTRDSNCVAALAMHSILLICAVAELVVAILVSVLTCAVTCHCNKQTCETQEFCPEGSPVIHQGGQVQSVQNVGIRLLLPNNGTWTPQTAVMEHQSTTPQAGQAELTSNTQSTGQSNSGYSQPTSVPVTGSRQQQLNLPV